MSDLKFSINSRKYLRKLITQAFSQKDTFSTLSASEKEVQKAQLKDFSDRVTSLDSTIQQLIWSEEEFSNEAEAEKKFESEFRTCEDYRSKIRVCLAELGTSRTLPVQSGAAETARSLLKSPIAPLPSFHSHEGEDLVKFFAEFEETVSKYNYPEYDKLLLLKQQLFGRAKTLVQSLEPDKQGYTHAKLLLLEALATPEIQKFNLISRLVSLKLNVGDDPFEYASNMRMITEGINRLKIDVKSIQQYFFWKGLNESFQSQLVQITNKTRPSFEEIKDKFFLAAERYEQLQAVGKNEKRKTTETNTTGLAVNVSYPAGRKTSFKPCSLCLNVPGKQDHPIYKCPSYSSVKSKLEKLVQLGGCSKCSNLNHKSDSCHYKFNSRCRHCSRYHFSFLCPDEKKNDANKDLNPTQTPVQTVGAGMAAIVEVMQGHSDSECILPTFTCLMGNRIVRCLKDGGSQSNFISASLADSLNLKTIEPVILIVNGINQSKQYNSRSVEIKIKLNNSDFVLRANVMPSINVNLSISNVGAVVKIFKNNGYILADKNLNEHSKKISDVDFILGTKSSHCLPETEIIFGQSSVFSNTSIGVMLKGNASQIIAESDKLPMVKVKDPEPVPGCLEINEHKVNFHKLETSAAACTIDEQLPPPVVQNIYDDAAVDPDIRKIITDNLNEECDYYTNYDKQYYEEYSHEINDKLVKFALDNTYRDSEGRLVMPLLWNSDVSHQLARNDHLSKTILNTNLKKLKNKPDLLKLMDDAVSEQLEMGIIKKIDNPSEFLQDHPSHSFLPHMGVFKLGRETTKCRIVFLSNLCQKEPNKPMSISHNQAIHSGPSLNQKLSSALLHLRFNRLLVCFDIKKAFNNIVLGEVDQNRLLFWWCRNVSKGDFTPVLYKNVRLTFGLRCSPVLLLLALYKILILDAAQDTKKQQDFKKLIYQLSYMDNCAYSSNSSTDLNETFNKLVPIFEPYKFGLQQFITNDDALQQIIDKSSDTVTADSVGLLGILWNRVSDELSTKPINLDVTANTKRTILSTIAAQFDLYNFNCPLLNRSRLFLHDLQCNKELTWDEKLPQITVRQWQNIAKQANSAPVLTVKRCVGGRNDEYRLVCFTDSSKVIFGCVLYILNLTTNQLSFVSAKNKIINSQLESKSIPALEIQGVSMGVECLIDIYKELSGPGCICPVKITSMHLYTDSMVALAWIRSYACTYDKMQKRSTFVMNRLNSISKLCQIFPIQFSFVAGESNPADCISRCMSSNMLSKTNYIIGPKFLTTADQVELENDYIKPIIVPNPDVQVPAYTSNKSVASFAAGTITRCDTVYSEVLERYSSLNKLVSVLTVVRTYIFKLKCRIYKSSLEKLNSLECPTRDSTYNLMVRLDQFNHFSDIFHYFENKPVPSKMPCLVGQLNAYVDKSGTLRVRSKFQRVINGKTSCFPILLAKNSRLTELIVLDYHQRMAHSGIYAVLSELRKSIWIPQCFTTVKKVLKSCILCRRLNGRTIKLNQSPYRDFRMCPPQVPYRSIFMDYIGPFQIKQSGQKVKIWLLCITCTWSRAINLKICRDMSLVEFLRAFQIHCFEFGVPSHCVTDLGTQMVAGANLIEDYLRDPDTKIYFGEQGATPIQFKQYYKGCSELGSLVESCVKITKRLIFGAIRNNVLDARDFEFIVCQTVHLANRRPIAFKESLRDDSVAIPDVITPEMLLRGHSLVSVSVIPGLIEHEPLDPDWKSGPVEIIRKGHQQLQKIRTRLLELYHSEFLRTLIGQATNLKGRYCPVKSDVIAVGDVVLIRDVHSKPTNYPMAVVTEITTNVNNEVTCAVVRKGSTGEHLKRHSSSLILLLKRERAVESSDVPLDTSVQSDVNAPRPSRAAAVICREKNKGLG